MNIRLLLYLFVFGFLYFSAHSYSSDFTLDELNELKMLDMLSEKDYSILLKELKGEEQRENLYNLKVNGIKVSEAYPVIIENGSIYLPVINLFNSIGFTNYSIESGILKATIGTDIREIIIKPGDPYTLIENNDFYIKSNKFKELFLRDQYIDKEISSISMRLSFETDEEIETYLTNVKDSLINSENAGELIFTNERTPFELGYVRLDFQGVLSKEGEDSSDRNFKSDWTGNLEYQGPLLYGEFTASYDVRERELGNLSLYYPDIYKNHSFEIENNGSGGTREWGATFKKERGYYIQGKNYVIRENVPIGSKVELLYLGFPIDVKDAIDGTVEFDNSEIQENRRYTLRIYEPNGKIYTIDIDTTSDYFQQNRGETEYDFSIREIDEYSRYSIEGNIYHGITDNLTLSLGYTHEPEDIGNEKIEDFQSLRGEIIYSNYFYRLPYTFVFTSERALNSNVVNDEGLSNKDRYSYDGTFQIDIKDFRIIAEKASYGKYFDEKSKDSYSLTYNPTGIFQIDYDWSKTKYNIDEKNDTDESVGLNISKGWNDFLITLNYDKSLNEKDNYEVNMYYNGLKRYNVQLTNLWSEEDKDLETILKLSNKNIFNILDYTLEFGYSDKYKEKFTFRFTLDYDNWLTGEIDIDESGAQRYSAGINRVVDLKNIRKPLESMDSTRVKVITFLDENDNGIMDKNEKTVEYVGVKIGSQEIDTDENGEAMFFGVPNKILYDMDPTIRKPSYTLGNTKIKILGQQVGTVLAHIPIKPMVTIVGEIHIDNSLTLSENKKIALFENMLIKVLDENGKIIEYLHPENNGTFEVSGLYAKKYLLEIEYTGMNNEIKEITESITLSHYDNEDNKFIIYIDKDKFTLKQIFLSEGKKYEKIISSNIPPSKL